MAGRLGEQQNCWSGDGTPSALLPPGEVQHNLHYLQLASIELELQNEELRGAEQELEEARALLLRSF